MDFLHFEDRTMRANKGRMKRAGWSLVVYEEVEEVRTRKTDPDAP